MTAFLRVDAPIGPDLEAEPVIRTLGALLAPGFLVAYLLVYFKPFELLRSWPGSSMSLLVPALGACALCTAPTSGLKRIPISFVILGLSLWMSATYFWTEQTFFSFLEIRNHVPSLVMLALVVGTMQPRVTISILAGFFALFGLWSIGASLLLPISSSGGGSWQGTFGHKNILGIFMVFALSLTLAFERRRSARPLLITLFIAVTLGTRSATAASGLIAVLISWFWLTTISRTVNPRDKALLKLLSVASIAFAIAIVIGLLPNILGLYGKDLTFTGRTEIWAASFNVALQRPVLGYGFGGLWHDGRSPVTAELWRQIGFPAAHAHNGALAIWLEAGLVGLSLYVLLVVRTLQLAVRQMRRESTAPYGRWAVMTVSALLLMSLSEPLYTGTGLAVLVMMWTVLARLNNMTGQSRGVRKVAVEDRRATSGPLPSTRPGSARGGESL